MDKPNYPGNNKSRVVREERETRTRETSEEKDVKKVVDGKVVIRKKTGANKLASSLGQVFEYVTQDVLIPAAKDMFSDAVSQGVDQMLFGETRSRRASSGRSSSSNRNGYVSYNRYSTPNARARTEEPPRTISKSARAKHDFNEIVLASRLEAEEVIDRMFDLVERYESATVSDLYELLGIQGKYTDDNWGWVDFRGATVRRIRTGYMLDIPEPEYLD